MPVILLPETENAYVTLDEIRALPNLGDENRFTDDELADAREWFETLFEDYTGMAFVPRAITARFVGACGAELMLPHWPVRSIVGARVYTSTTAYTAFTADELADILIDGVGSLRRYSLGYWPSDVEIDYVHGQAAPPADVKREALVAIQEKLMEDNSGRPADRTYGVATDGVFVRSILPGEDKPFGIASVDECANRYRAKCRVPALGGSGVTVITGPTPTPPDSYGGGY
jgi:hypothetical protein